MNTKISSIFPLNINAIIQQLLGKENYNQITNDMLHCSSLCGLKMAPKLRNALMSATKELTIPCLLEELLSNGTGSRGNKFNLTSRQRLEVERAYNAFNTLRQDSTANGRPLTDRLAWIIPDKHFHKNGSIRRDIHHEIYTEIKKYSGLTAYEWETWLPWMSLGIEIRLQSWRAPKISCLRRALFKLSKKYDDEQSGANYPWETNYPNKLGVLPIPVLYQFEPDKKTLDGISTLLNIGLKQVNHLRILHPEAIQFAKDRRSPCKYLYRILNSNSTS